MLEFKGASDLLIMKSNSNVVHGAGTLTALQMFDQWCAELNITDASKGSFNADDSAWVFNTPNSYKFGGVDFINKFMYSSEAGFGLYDIIPSNTAATNSPPPNVNRLYVSTTKPILTFSYHWPGGDLKSYETQWKENANGFCIFAKHSQCSGTTNSCNVAICVSASGIQFYFEKISAGTIPLYANTSDGTAWVNQYTLATIFDGGASNTLVTLLSEAYKPQGNILIDAGNIVKSTKLYFEVDKPLGTDVVVEASYNQTDWTACDYGATLLSGHIYIKVTLSTQDSATSPTLKDLWLEDASAPQDKILITVDQFARFNNVEGQLKVSYNSALGTLVGVGGAVQSFDAYFTPTDLLREINPNDEETIRTVISSAVLDYSLISYINASSTEEHTINAVASVVVEYTDVTIVNP